MGVSHSFYSSLSFWSGEFFAANLGLKPTGLDVVGVDGSLGCAVFCSE
jgi:hypothetical protein